MENSTKNKTYLEIEQKELSNLFIIQSETLPKNLLGKDIRRHLNTPLHLNLID